MAATRVIVLTNCTNRKRALPGELLMARSLPQGKIAPTSRLWVSRLQNAASTYSAEELYCGRSLTETLTAARQIGAEVAFISAGLGVVRQRQLIPPYSLTTSMGYPDSVASRINESFDPAAWWQALSISQGGSGRPLREFLEVIQADLVLCAMPASYLALINREMTELSPRFLKTTRVIGPRRRDDVPEALRPYWLPYDARLDCADTGYNGTAGDFPHRALRHFTQEILPTVGLMAASDHSDSVERALEHFAPYVRPRGQTASDDEVILAIRALWHLHQGKRAGILRALRSERNVACEQTRFRQLMDKFEENRRGAAQKKDA